MRGLPSLAVVVLSLGETIGCGSSTPAQNPSKRSAGIDAAFDAGEVPSNGTDANTSAARDATAGTGGGGGSSQGAGGAADASTSPSDSGGLPDAPAQARLVDPGAAAWVAVPAGEVTALCQLDPQKLADLDAKLKLPWAIVRHGRLCHESLQSATMKPAEAFSSTKTLSAIVAGAVSYQTRQIARSGRKTGPFSDEDRVDQWLDSVSYNPDAHVGHVLGMVAHNASLALGKKTMQYDADGSVQLNTLSDMMNAAIRQDSARLGNDVEQFTKKFVYGPLGMTESTWSGGAPNKQIANTWSTTVHDMARIGLLMLNHGMWNGERLVAAEWIYRMTHPSFEDANTGYGYLAWVNSSSNHNYGLIGGAPVGPQQGAAMPGPCAPVAVFASHPHGLSDSPSCNYAAPYTCEQQYDDGVWQAVGRSGQVIQGHPGLDLVIIAREVTPGGLGLTSPGILWNAVRPAIVAGDPKFAGDDTGFCAAYGRSSYAPDLR